MSGTRRWTRLIFTITTLCLVCPIIGCGHSEPTGTVSGLATCKGKPVADGEIVFVSLDQFHAASGEVDSQGNYKLRKPLKVGTYRVAFVPTPPPIDENSDAPPKRKTSPVNFKRQNPETTDLQFEIKPGDNVANFEF